MTATKYYVAACRLVIQANPDNVNSWQVGLRVKLNQFVYCAIYLFYNLPPLFQL